ncbi:hypothetical protein [Streptomyces sp. NPDC002564]|uniref:hypothetical protein n=1 Tax=Streptomyces sp. NPDC002564 TaxID=3364649 RepID=UPI0036AC9EFA
MRDHMARALGAATVLYSAAIMIRPRWLAGPCGLAETDGSVSTGTAVLVRAIGARDTALGAAIVFAPTPVARRTALWCRAAADLSDAVLFGAAQQDPARRAKIAAVAGGWAALNAAAAQSLTGRPHS